MKSFDEIYDFSHAVDGNGTHDHPVCTATEKELKALIPYIMTLLYGSRIVELGTYTGRSTSIYFQVQKDLNLDIHLIDCLNWNPEFAATTFWCNLVIRQFNDVPFTYYKMFSEQVLSRWTLPIDFLYIDGAHDAPGVDHDFANWPKFIKPGGIMAAHDSQYPGVAPCLDRFIKNEGWQLLLEAERMTIWRKPY
jgi:predicted O-methyltransferase YrrM